MIIYRELSSLSQDLGFRPQTLYAVSNHLEKHYRRVQLPKNGGGCRSLSVPDPILKAIQRQITDILLIHMPVSQFATAYRCGSSVMHNATPHIGKDMVLKLDILHFFDSIRYSAVKDAAFPPQIYAEPLRILLAMLCYYRDSLPQGAPSSPAISNILLYSFDRQIGQWCAERGIAYTRYCDDMTFSGSCDPMQVISLAVSELGKLGFLLNTQKTRILHPGQQQSVTGLIVNEKLSIPSNYRRKLRQELYYCQKYGISSHLQHLGLKIPEAQYRQKLLGQVNYVLQVMPQNPQMQAARQFLLASREQ